MTAQTYPSFLFLTGDMLEQARVCKSLSSADQNYACSTWASSRIRG